MKNKYHFTLRPDAQAFDEIRLVTIPRYKTSGLSGDEWRIQVYAQFMRKGKVLYEEPVGSKMERAVLHLGHWFDVASDRHGYFAGEEDWCDQEGCPDKAKIIYKVKKSFCSEPYNHEPIINIGKHRDLYRKFCIKHKERGDCAFDDADENYELVEEIP